MLTKNLYLLVDPNILSGYVVSQWIADLEKLPEFQGILVKGNAPSAEILQGRRAFHANYAGQKQLTDKNFQQLNYLYSGLDETEKAMINLFGVSRYSATEHAKTFFLGDDINQEYSKNLLKERCKGSPPSIFTFVTQILKPWWIQITNSQVYNLHGAVLPYARGMYSVESTAMLRDSNQFRKVAGFTIHYIDEGVDTGPIIRAERIINPFRFNSIAEVRAFSYLKGIDAFIQTARDIIGNDQMVAAGVMHNPELRGANCRIKHFTPDRQKEAEAAFRDMKSQVMSAEKGGNSATNLPE